MAKDINKKAFDEATKLKLNIFGECFEEWLPVFNNNYTDQVYIFDLFAGSGKDINDVMGSPLVLFDKAKGTNRKYCLRNNKDTKFIFNDFEKDKSEELEKNIITHLEQCKYDNECNECVYRYKVVNSDFKDFFSEKETLSIFENNRIGKFILLDQYGFKQIDEDVFKQLISFPKTDFIFFISSSFINRFKKHPNTTKYIDTSKIDFDSAQQPKEIHRVITDYFRKLIPSDKEYYLHQFSIQKEENKSNYYGLIFGTNHTLGMEKFLKVCWKYDELSGEANFNIDNNHERGTLFFQPENTIKKTNVSEEIKELILSGEIINNRIGLKYALQKGCLPKIFTEAVKELEKSKKIERIGDKNHQSTNIHKVPIYNIKVLKT